MVSKLRTAGFGVPDEYLVELFDKHTAYSVYNATGKLLHMSESLANMLGYMIEEVNAYHAEHSEVTTLFYPDPQYRAEIIAGLKELADRRTGYERIFWPTKKDGTKIAVKFITEPLFDKESEFAGTARFAQDVTAEMQAKEDALHDDKTCLLNEKGFNIAFSKLVVGGDKKSGVHRRVFDILENESIRLAVAYLDIDDFKVLNEFSTHDDADTILAELATMLHRKFRETDIVARLGGDEYAVVCETHLDEAEMERGMFARKISAHLSEVLNELSRTVFVIREHRLVEKVLY